MTKRLIYLQYGFWKKLRNGNSVEEKRLFWDLYGALECSNIKADIPAAEWGEDKDDLLYYLLQNSADGYGTKIERCSSETIQGALDCGKEQPIDNLCAVFLLDEETMACKARSRKMGVLCLNADMIKEHRFVRGDAIKYEKDEVSDSFKKCEKHLSSPCNSMIIIDPYILFNKWSIEYNLIPLLEKCLPPDPKEEKGQQYLDFHLSLLSQTNECNVGRYKDKLRYKEIYDYVNSLIREKRPNLRMKFSLYHINTTGNGDGDFHSRHILTNCMLINSEDGFDIFKSKQNEHTKKWEVVSGKHARLEFLFPTLIDNRRLDAENYYRWINISAKNCVDNALCWGDKENRLFEIARI